MSRELSDIYDKLCDIESEIRGTSVADDFEFMVEMTEDPDKKHAPIDDLIEEHSVHLFEMAKCFNVNIPIVFRTMFVDSMKLVANYSEGDGGWKRFDESLPQGGQSIIVTRDDKSTMVCRYHNEELWFGNNEAFTQSAFLWEYWTASPFDKS